MSEENNTITIKTPEELKEHIGNLNIALRKERAEKRSLQEELSRYKNNGNSAGTITKEQITQVAKHGEQNKSLFSGEKKEPENKPVEANNEVDTMKQEYRDELSILDEQIRESERNIMERS